MLRGTFKPRIRGADCQYPLRCFTHQQLSVGIDLGTTNSAIAILQNGKPILVPNREGCLTTPSVVSHLPNGKIVVGAEARKLAGQNPKKTYYSVKRLIGRNFDDVASERRRLGYDITRAENGDVLLRNDESTLRPEEVSAEVIKHLLSYVKDHCSVNDIKRCVISVPAYFDEKQRAATVAAGLLSGLEKVRLIHEPLASALAYGLDLNQDQTVCVFDLGGGTLDICILELGNGVTEVLATGGDSRLGGDDIDSAIVDWLRKEHLSKLPEVALTSKLKSNLKRLAEFAKIKLSTETKVRLTMQLEDGPLQVTLSRNHLEKLSKPLFKRMRDALDRCCWQAGVDLLTLQDERDDQTQSIEIRPKNRSAISDILLVGAATRMPALSKFLRNMTSLELRKAVDPDKCVAMGAALEAGRLSGELSDDFIMMDVWQASLLRAFANDQGLDKSLEL